MHKFPAPRHLERRAHLYELDKSSSYIRAEINNCPHFFCRRLSSCATTAVTANTLFPIYCAPRLCFAYKMLGFFSFWRTSRGRGKWVYFRLPPIFSPIVFYFTVEHLANIFIHLLIYLFNCCCHSCGQFNSKALKTIVFLSPSLFSCSYSVPSTSGSFRHSSPASILTLLSVEAGYVNNSMFGNHCPPSYPGKSATGEGFLGGDVQ